MVKCIPQVIHTWIFPSPDTVYCIRDLTCTHEQLTRILLGTGSNPMPGKTIKLQLSFKATSSPCNPSQDSQTPPQPPPPLIHLSIVDTEVSLPSLLPLLQQLTVIHSLDLSKSPNIIPVESNRHKTLLPPFCRLNSLSTVTRLNLSNCVLTGAQLEALAPFVGSLESLQSLCLRGNLLEDNAMFALARPLRRLTLLDTLDFSRCHITGNGVNELCCTLQKLPLLQV